MDELRVREPEMDEVDSRRLFTPGCMSLMFHKVLPGTLERKS